MKTNKLIVLSVLAFFLTGNLFSQSADEIISKYIQAIGGKDRLSRITSLYTEGTIEAMGAQGTIKSATLNGKGSRTDIDIAGYSIISCYTDKEGWSVNPMIGTTSAEIMPAAQYNLGKDQVTIGGPFINYAEKGYKVELLGIENTDGINSYKIRFTSPDNISSVYFFDTATFNLVKAVSQAMAAGQITESVTKYSDFRQAADGYAIPYKIDMDLAGGQYIHVITITKVEFNRPVDESIFAKP